MIDFIRKLFIPRKTIYCHHSFKIGKTGKKSGMIYAKPCKNLCMKYDKEYGYKREYCKYLKKFLEIQDEVKDCEVE